MSNPAYAVTDHRGMTIGSSIGILRGETAGKHKQVTSDPLSKPVVSTVTLGSLMGHNLHWLIAEFAFDDGIVLRRKAILSVSTTVTSLDFGDVEYRCKGSDLYKMDKSKLEA